MMRRIDAHTVKLALALSVLFILCAMAMVSVFRWVSDPNGIDIANRFAAPSSDHLFGTDQFGRDIFSRIVSGASITVLIGVLSTVVGFFAGLCIGAFAGYNGGLADDIMMRLTDGLMAFPGILLALAVVSVLGPGTGNLILAIGLMEIPTFARLTRAGFLKIKELQFVEAARALGAGDLQIARKHILPGVLPPLLVQLSFAFSSAVLTEAALSYLGLGVQPPDPSWGRMLKEAQTTMGTAPWTAIAPGIAIAAAVLGANLLGEAVSEKRERR